jgi:hypothetical protein
MMNKVSLTTLTLRLREDCKKSGQKLVICKTNQDYDAFGEAYIVDIRTNTLVANGSLKDLTVDLLADGEELREEFKNE